MKVEGKVFAVVAAFLTGTSLVYWYMSKDPTGGVALAFSAGLAFLIGYYLYFTARRMAPRPEDLGEAEIADGAGEVGFFSPHSWWPVALAAGASLAALGLAFGIWLIIIGAVTLLAALTGLLFEYYLGHYRREQYEAGSN